MTAPSNVPRLPTCALCTGTNGGHDVDCPALAADAQAVGILPCPFCGVSVTPRASHGGQAVTIACTNEACIAMAMVSADTKEEAIAHWNHRP
jgi:hypothetical protein